MRQVGYDARSTGAERVAEGNGAAELVRLLVGQAELLLHGEELRGKGFVDLDGSVDVLQRQAGTLQRKLGGLDGSNL